MALIKSISGIRGTIGGRPGEGLSPIDIVKFTYAYEGIFLHERLSVLANECKPVNVRVNRNA